MIEIEIDWHTEKRKVSDLKEWADNPRTISDKEYENLKQSIIKRGFHDVLKIDENNVVLSGNQRLKALIELGVEEVECKISDTILTRKQKDAVALESNTQAGEWDMDKLAEGYGDVMEEIGFGDLMPEVEMDVEEDDYEEPEDLEVRVKLGEVWQLGKHRLMAGDSTKIEDVEKLMNGQKADMVFTDPPYNVDYEGKTKDALKIQNDKFESDNSFYQFLLDAYTNLLLSTKEGASVYVTHADTERVNFTRAFLDAGFYLSSVIIWIKNNATFGRQDYKWKHEPILYGWNSKGKHRWEGAMNENTTWMIDRPSRSEEHPTMKPIELISRAIQNSSKSEDVVLDAFGGSGSTLIACEQTNRVCYMMELDEHYCTVILDRWEKLTGEVAIKLED